MSHIRKLQYRLRGKIIPPLQQSSKPVAVFGSRDLYGQRCRLRGQRHRQFRHMVSSIGITLEEGPDDRIRLNVNSLLCAAHEAAQKCQNRHVFFVCHSRL